MHIARKADAGRNWDDLIAVKTRFLHSSSLVLSRMFFFFSFFFHVFSFSFIVRKVVC